MRGRMDLTVSDLGRSKSFYDLVLGFLGILVLQGTLTHEGNMLATPSSIALTPVRKNPSARGSFALPRDAVV